MARQKRHSAEEIVNKLRQADVELSKGATIAQACKQIGITDQTYYRWRRHYNIVRPHSSLEHRPPVPEAIIIAAEPCSALHASAATAHTPLD